MINRKPIVDDLNLRKTSFPSDVIVEVSGECNFECPICPSHTMRRKRGQMSLDTFKLIADEVAQYLHSRLWMGFMGEPLLNYRLIDMIKYAYGCDIHLNTNGQFLDGSIADELLDLTYIKQIIISLDGFTGETYRKTRTGDFHTVRRNARKFIQGIYDKESPTDVVIQFIVQDCNQHEVEPFIKYWIGLGAIVKVRLKAGWGHLPTEDLAGVERNFPCPWLVRAMPILWDGRMAMCDADYEGIFAEGKVGHSSIYDIWNHSIHADVRNRHWNGDYSFPMCAECDDWAVGKSRFYYPDGRVE